MNDTPHNTPNSEQLEEERLLAFLLGETDEATSAKIQQLLENDPSLISKASRLQNTSVILKEALETPVSDSGAPLAFDADRRAQLISRFAQPAAHEEKKKSKLLNLSHPIWGFGIAACFVCGISFSILYQTSSFYSSSHYEMEPLHRLSVAASPPPPSEIMVSETIAHMLEEPPSEMKLQQLEMMLNPGSGEAIGNLSDADFFEDAPRARLQSFSSELLNRRQTRREQLATVAPDTSQPIGRVIGSIATARESRNTTPAGLPDASEAPIGQSIGTLYEENLSAVPHRDSALLADASTSKSLFGHYETKEDEEIFELSPFIVSADSDSGYRATNTLSGSRLRTRLSDRASKVDTNVSRYMFFSPAIPTQEEYEQRNLSKKKESPPPPRISFQDDSPIDYNQRNPIATATTPGKSAGQAETVRFNLADGLASTQQTNEPHSLRSTLIADEEIRPTPKPPSTSLTEYPETVTADDPQSTFSLNVSDVSYKLAVSYINNGIRPPDGSLRTEEFINAFNYGDPTPHIDRKIGFTWERALWPWAHNRDVIRFSIQTAADGRSSKQPLNLVLAIDNSGSMSRPDRVEIVNSLAAALQSHLNKQDRLSLVSFDRSPRLLLDGQRMASTLSLPNFTQQLNPQGGTDLESALKLAYETANRHHNEDAINRVILITDGAANLGNTDVEELRKAVIENRARGIALDCFGIGFDGHDDTFLESLSRNGDGRYRFLRSSEDATRELGEKLAGMLRPAAYDVKVQVEFNPERVELYQQLGYQQHQIADEDFRNNAIDAAELAAAEAGTALYLTKILPHGQGDLGLVRVRYRDAESNAYKEMSWNLPYKASAPELSKASPSLQLASAAAAFAALLNESPIAQEVDFTDLYQFTKPLKQAFPTQSQVQTLPDLIHQAKRLYR